MTTHENFDDFDNTQDTTANIAACVAGGLAFEGSAVVLVLQSEIVPRIVGLGFAGIGAVALTAASRIYFESRSNNTE